LDCPDTSFTISSIFSAFLLSTSYLTDEPLTLDHQQRFFTGWGHIPPANVIRSAKHPISTAESAKGITRLQQPPDEPSMEKNLKTPSLGLIWTNQLACRIALSKSPVYSSPIPAAQSLLDQMVTGTLGQEDNGELGKEKEIIGWKRYLRVVFASWAAPTLDNSGEGRKFEVWEGGIRSTQEKSTENG